MSDIQERVKKIIIEQLGVKEEEVKNESSFVDDLGADSLDTVELVMALEEEFDTEIPDEEAEKITTVQSAPKSSTKEDSFFTSSSLTPSCSMIIFFTRSWISLILLSFIKNANRSEEHTSELQSR